jgi:hypothetical protein
MSPPSNPPPRPPPTFILGRQILAGSLAASFTAALFNPLEVCKTRLQVQHTLPPHLRPAGRLPYSEGFLRGMRKIARDDGVRRFWGHGLSSFVARDFVYSGIRMGLYTSLRNQLGGGGEAQAQAPAQSQAQSQSQPRSQSQSPSQPQPQPQPADAGLAAKIAAGMTTGAVGSLVANPLDVARVRTMAEGGRVGADGRLTTGMFVGERARYSGGLVSTMVTTGREEGLVRGLYRGSGASMARAALLSSGQLASYDHSKLIMREHLGMEEGAPMHTTAAIISGFVAATVCNPADVLKSRIMVSQGGVGPWAVAVDIVRTEGVRGFFRGWLPAYSRHGPAFFVQMPIVERLRTWLGVDNI